MSSQFITGSTVKLTEQKVIAKGEGEKQSKKWLPSIYSVWESKKIIYFTPNSLNRRERDRFRRRGLRQSKNPYHQQSENVWNPLGKKKKKKTNWESKSNLASAKFEPRNSSSLWFARMNASVAAALFASIIMIIEARKKLNKKWWQKVFSKENCINWNGKQIFPPS